MKVLWFTNIPMPKMMETDASKHAGTGGWMMSLLDKLAVRDDIELSVCCVSPILSNSGKISKDGIKYFSISQGKRRRIFCYRNLDNNSKYLDKCLKVVQKINPDVIHVHGTERFYGLLAKKHETSVPIVISLQGLLHIYCRWRYYFGMSTLTDIFACHRLLHLLRGLGPMVSYFKCHKSAQRELEILKNNQWFMGRTDWARTHLLAVNPCARYFDVPEPMRPSFYNTKWSIKSCKRYRIIFTNARSFVRGVETLLKAGMILKRQFPNIKLALAGGAENGPYGKRLKMHINSMDLNNNVEFLGMLDEQKMTRALCDSHVFAITSLLENSPNSLCEAQLVGMPCVASYTGGIPSLVDEGCTGLLFQPGDEAMLAARIREIFINDDLAKSLGHHARKTALVRHNPSQVTQTVLSVYETVIQECQMKKPCQ